MSQDLRRTNMVSIPRKGLDINLDSTQAQGKASNEDLREVTTKYSLSSEVSDTKNEKKTGSKLSMVWVKEFDNKRERLVAKWITEA
jgi:hypothetical protein